MHRPSKATQLIVLAGLLLVTFVAAAVGAIASANAGEFYSQLDRPPWAPPSWLFAPVWTVLYLMMAVAAWLVWRARGFDEARGPLLLYIVQLVANALWTWIFFAWQRGGLAFAEILILLVLVLATIVAFWKVRTLAGALLVPYLFWVAYASVLTYAVWQRNPSLG